MNNSSILPVTLRSDFPLLSRKTPSGEPLIYFDTAATALKPQCVIDAVVDILANHTANVNRAVHFLGDEINELFEGARNKIARMIGAESHEVILVRNTTEAINLVARSYPRRGRVLASRGEHHSNLLPWTINNATLLPTLNDGTVDRNAVENELRRGGVSIVSVSHLSNVTGLKNDVAELAKITHSAGAILIVDAAQSAPHLPIDVFELDCDFLAFSGHKMYGPSGVGVLYGKAERLAEIDWYLHGGGVVEEVSAGIPKQRQSPWRFEAGTPSMESVVGFGAAIDYLQALGMDAIERHCHQLRQLAREQLLLIPGVKVLGDNPTQSNACGPISFTVANKLSHMVARALSDAWGICVRSGYQCAQPLHESLASPPSLRLSFGVYNQPFELDRFFEAFGRIMQH